MMTVLLLLLLLLLLMLLMLLLRDPGRSRVVSVDGRRH